MAGEWTPIDNDIWRKPEVLELVDITGVCRDSVVGRLHRMWAWVGSHTANGTVRVTPERLGYIAEGDADFWRAVETVGWVTFDAAAGTMTVIGWEARFSRAAKAREADRIRKSAERQRDSSARPESVQESSDAVRTETGPEERRILLSPSSHACARGEEAAALRAAWDSAAEAGFVKPFAARDLPAGLWDRLVEPGWFEDALQAIQRLARCRFFADDPASFKQLVAIDRKGCTFVSKVLAGDFDASKKPKGTPVVTGDRPSAEEAARRFERRDPKTAALAAAYVAAKQARRAKA